MSLDPAEEIVDEYFEYLADRDVYRAPTVLSWFTDYIDSHNEHAIYKLLQHDLAPEAVAGLVDLLEFDDKRLTESVVHILGTIVEHPRCRQYVLEVPRNTATTGQNNPTLFTALVSMLMSEDKNVVMNAAGTIANIAESADGRLWILQQAAFDDALPILGLLSVDSHQWAASNSALVIARLTLSQEGVVKLLTHDRSSYILTNLCLSLCGHNPGSSMNAAFAVGRLLEREDARGKLLEMKNFKNTMTAMTKMLYNKEAGPRKNACFAFSCLANSKEGHSRLLGNVNSELILDQLVRLITDVDDETAWFAAVTLRSVCSQKEGVFRLRDHKTVYSVLKKLVRGGSGVKLKSELLTEVRMTLDIIGKLPKLPAPMLSAVNSSSVTARWDSVIASMGSRITYQLYQGCTCVYEGSSTHTEVRDLKPFTSYVFRVRAISAADEGPYSGPAIITTNEGVPASPGGVTNEGKPQHNSVKISWAPPSSPNGTLTGYNIYSNGERIAVVGLDKLQFTVRDLPHSTSVGVQVAAVTSAGEGEKSAPIMCSTLNLSDYPPRKPILSTSGGSNEINVSWIDPPKQLGAVDHYELVMNGEVIYSGKEQGFRVSNLEPLAEYIFNVRVVTADDYVIESEPAKKRAGSKEDFSVDVDKNLQNERDQDRAAREEAEAALRARLEEEAERLRKERAALEAQLLVDEDRRRLEAEHRLTLGSRGGPAYSIDDPDVAACLSDSLLAKLKALGITHDITNLDEKDLQLLKENLTEEELNELIDAIYMAKHLNLSPALMKFIKKSGLDPLSLWKLNYTDVNDMDLSPAHKKELFKSVLEQQNSFVANVEIPTSRMIVLKGWKDENLAFLPLHDARLVTKDLQAKEELNQYIDKLRAVVQKGGSPANHSTDDEELPDVEQQRTPTPEIAKPVSDNRQIIRPKKKPDRFTTPRKMARQEPSPAGNTAAQQGNTAAQQGNTAAQHEGNAVQHEHANNVYAQQGLATIEEDSYESMGESVGDAAPAAVSDVIVTRQVTSSPETRAPPNTAETSALSAKLEDPRSVAVRALQNKDPLPSKTVHFSEQVRVNTAGVSTLTPASADTVSCYVPHVVSCRVKAFDPECVADVSDTAISVENKSQENSIEFLVDYVTTYEAKSGDSVLDDRTLCEAKSGGTVDSSAKSGVTVADHQLTAVDPKVPIDTVKSVKFVGKAYEHALTELEKAVRLAEANSAAPRDTSAASRDTSTASLSHDTISAASLSLSEASEQKILITSLSSLTSLDSGSETPSVGEASPLLMPAGGRRRGRAREDDLEDDAGGRRRGRAREDDLEDEDVTAVYSLSDIQIFEKEKDRLSEHMTVGKKENEQDVRGYKKHSNMNKFNIDDVRKKDTEIYEQNKLITALIAQQNDDLFQQTKRTKEIIDTVRKNIRNSIHEKRVEPSARQVSTNKFLHASHNVKKNVKLSSVDMNFFGDIDSVAHKPRVLQVNSKSTAAAKSGNQKRKRKKAKLPPLEKCKGPVPRDLQFTFRKL